MTLASPARACVLVVDDESDARELLQRTLRRHYDVVTAADGAAALEVLRSRRVDLLLSDFRMPGMTGVELLDMCAREVPRVTRALITAYDDLPEIVRAQAQGLAEMVLAKPFNPAALRTSVDTLLGARPEAPAARAEGVPTASQLLGETIRDLVRSRGVVIRQLPKEGAAHLQFVLPLDEGQERFREALPLRWRWPAKPAGQKLPRTLRRHPVMRVFRGFALDQELYLRSLGDSSTAYLAILPWGRERRVTLVLGVTGPTGDDDFRPLIRQLHAQAVQNSLELPLPSAPGGERHEPWYAADYDWVVAPGYVGPDRRSRSTSFINRYVIFGRRRRLPGALAATEVFIDRLTPTTLKLGLLYLVLSGIDTLLTLWFVSSGTYAELNPVLRPFISHPVAFVAVKNAISLSALFVVVRFQLLTSGKVVLWLNAAIYAALDVYWLYLLVNAAP